MLFNCKKEHEQWLAQALEDLSKRGAEDFSMMLIARTNADDVVVYPHNCTLGDLVMMNGFIGIHANSEYLKSAPLEVIMIDLDEDDDDDELRKLFEEE